MANTACTAAGCEWLQRSVRTAYFVPKVSIRRAGRRRRAQGVPGHGHRRQALGSDPENRTARNSRPAGADAVIDSFHPRSVTKQPAAVAQRIREAGVAPGIVLNPGTAVASIAPLLDIVDLAVVMLVSPGHGGPEVHRVAVEKVRALRAAPGPASRWTAASTRRSPPSYYGRARTCSSRAAPSSRPTTKRRSSSGTRRTSVGDIQAADNKGPPAPRLPSKTMRAPMLEHTTCPLKSHVD